MPNREYDCNNPQDQVEIAGLHQITQSTFNNYVSNFFGGSAAGVSPTVKTWEELTEAMMGQDCTQMQWKLDMDENDTSNNNITLTIQPMLETTVNYSIALFKGVKQAHNTVAAFHFYKAKKGDDSYDIIFKAVDESGNAEYYGDLSDIHPR